MHNTKQDTQNAETKRKTRKTQMENAKRKKGNAKHKTQTENVKYKANAKCTTPNKKRKTLKQKPKDVILTN